MSFTIFEAVISDVFDSISPSQARVLRAIVQRHKRHHHLGHGVLCGPKGETMLSHADVPGISRGTYGRALRGLRHAGIIETRRTWRGLLVSLPQSCPTWCGLAIRKIDDAGQRDLFQPREIAAPEPGDMRQNDACIGKTKDLQEPPLPPAATATPEPDEPAECVIAPEGGPATQSPPAAIIEPEATPTQEPANAPTGPWQAALARLGAALPGETDPDQFLAFERRVESRARRLRGPVGEFDCAVAAGDFETVRLLLRASAQTWRRAVRRFGPQRVVTEARRLILEGVGTGRTGGLLWYRCACQG